ncbi:rhamnulokinase [Microbacterium halotolerans]|uniref:rhamnulokinase n=1 Tax=Microbacterium halotolerans TaxID=246613 RepID=UPI000E6ABD6E|nr:rhamnulokinase family protein [Microbacterium halotolerans]
MAQRGTAGHFAAIDLGATSGRVIRGVVSRDRIEQVEASRFANRPVMLDGTLHWDVLSLWRGVIDGLSHAVRDAPQLRSVAVDTWGVDYGLLRDGRLIANPVHYRDARTADELERVHAAMPEADLYARTGVEPLAINTIYQLAAEVRGGLLDVADTVLLTPDLFSYWLSGAAVAEQTIASTTGLLSAATGDWDDGVLAALGLSRDLLAPITRPGERIGALRSDVAAQIGATNPIDVIAVGAHDTASAVVAVPMPASGGAFISCGTWGLVGVERRAPVLTPEALAAGVTNERGVDDRFLTMRNGMGLWILSETQRCWEAEGESADIRMLLAEAEDAPVDVTVFDVEDARFQPPGDMPARIAAWCAEHDLPAPVGRGAVVRSIIESLAQAFAEAVAEIGALSGEPATQINVVGGGSRNELLCQRLADRSQLPVLAGPVEATGLGSLLVQARTAGVVDGTIEDLRDIVIRTFSPRLFRPRSL